MKRMAGATLALAAPVSTGLAGYAIAFAAMAVAGLAVAAPTATALAGAAMAFAGLAVDGLAVATPGTTAMAGTAMAFADLLMLGGAKDAADIEFDIPLLIIPAFIDLGTSPAPRGYY